MSRRRAVLPVWAPAVAMLVALVSLLGNGCDKRRTGDAAAPAGSSAAVAERAPAPPRKEAPVREEAASPGQPAETARRPGRPAASAERTSGLEPVEASEVTDASFAGFIGNGVALVDFWSPRCPPCRLQGPIVDKLAETFKDRAAVGKLQVDLNREAPERLGFMYIPTLIVFKDGKELKRFTGLTREATLASALEEALTGE